MEHELSNEEVKIAVSDHGAELTHLVKKATGEEYIWSGEDYWKRHSPVLFPFVGNVAEGYYSVKGKKNTPWASTVLPGIWTSPLRAGQTAYGFISIIRRKPCRSIPSAFI